MLDPIYHMTLKLFWNDDFVGNIKIFPYKRDIIMGLLS